MTDGTPTLRTGLKALRRSVQRCVRRLFPLEPRRLELKFVPYYDAEELLKDGWTLAKEEDNNTVLGWVWLEKLELKQNPRRRSMARSNQ